MDLDFKQILLGSMSKEGTVEHRFEGNALIIECRECGFMPEPGSKECMRCMVERMSESGGVDRIILRTGRDLEISGRTGQALKRMASLKRGSCSVVRNTGRCRRCPSQRNRVMETVWNDFPYPNFYGGKALLDDDKGDETCMRCISSTRRAIAQIETDMEDLRKGLVKP